MRRGIDRLLAPVDDNRRRRSVRWASADDRVRQTKAVSVTGNEAEEAADSSGAGPIQTRSGCYWCIGFRAAVWRRLKSLGAV
jgi:hypothetical protein